MADHVHQPGDKFLERYEIINFIGEGGMQEVYKATDHALERVVALKVPKNTSAKKRFGRSAEMSARVNHPNVAKTFDYFSVEDRFYLVEEFIPGSDLQKRLDGEFNCFDPHLAAHLMHHVAKGLAACHHAEVFHRDLKPSNIMVSLDPSFTTTKLTDFGIAKMAEAEIEEATEGGEDSISGSKTVVGALPYMAPELIQNSKTATKAADIWSFGAILFYLLTGEKPFGTGLQAVVKILGEELPTKDTSLKVKNPQFSTLLDSLWGVIEDCMRKDPAQRPAADALVSRFSTICYSTAPRRVGAIYNYQVKRKEWGFITSSACSDCFFHKDSFYGKAPKDGMKVSYACFPGLPKDRAFPVLPLKS